MRCHLKKIQLQRLQKLQVSLVYLFGSHAEGKDQPLSDFDIGVVFLQDISYERDCRKIYHELYDIFSDIFPCKNIDIVFLQKAGLELCMDVIQHGRILFEHSKDRRMEFEERITLLYADFKPLLNEFDRAVLDRISL